MCDGNKNRNNLIFISQLKLLILNKHNWIRRKWWDSNNNKDDEDEDDDDDDGVRVEHNNVVKHTKTLI